MGYRNRVVGWNEMKPTATSVSAKLFRPLEALSTELILNCFVPFRPQSSSSLSCHLGARAAILLGWDPVICALWGNIYIITENLVEK